MQRFADGNTPNPETQHQESHGTGTLSRRARWRFAAIAALVGVVLISLDNGVLGNPPRSSPLEMLQYVNDRPWFLSRFAGLFGILAWAVAFSVLGRTLLAPVAGMFAKLAQTVLTVATAVFAVQYAHDGFALGTLARRWSAGEISDRRAESHADLVNGLVGGASVLSQCLLGLGVALYTVALLVSRAYPRALCWLGVVAAAGWFFSAAAHFSQVPGTVFEIILQFAGVTAIWVIILSVVLLWRSRPAATVPAGT